MVIPSSLGPYRVGEPLATLPLGELVAVSDPVRPTPLVAIILTGELARESRFRTALRLAVARAGGARHPSLARSIEVREADGQLAVVYEAPSSTTLEAAPTVDPARSPDAGLAMIRALAGGLDVAHSRGLAHGLLGAVEEAGLADALGDDIDMHYVAPEQTSAGRALASADG